MSALGQKQTCAAQNVMSALPPIADMCGASSCLLCANSGHQPIRSPRRHGRSGRGGMVRKLMMNSNLVNCSGGKDRSRSHRSL